MSGSNGEARISTSLFSRAKSFFSFLSSGFSGMEKVKDSFFKIGIFLSFVVLALVLLSWGSLLIYKKVLTNQIFDLKEQQSKIFGAKEKEMATSIISLEKGSIMAQSLLKNHIYSSVIFEEVAKATLPRVQWLSLDFSLKELSLVARGLASDYSFLAKQILAFEEAGFSNLKISNISLDKSGGVAFGLVLNFDYKILQK